MQAARQELHSKKYVEIQRLHTIVEELATSKRPSNNSILLDEDGKIKPIPRGNYNEGMSTSKKI